MLSQEVKCAHARALRCEHSQTKAGAFVHLLVVATASFQWRHVCGNMRRTKGVVMLLMVVSERARLALLAAKMQSVVLPGRRVAAWATSYSSWSG